MNATITLELTQDEQAALLELLTIGEIAVATHKTKNRVRALRRMLDKLQAACKASAHVAFELTLPERTAAIDSLSYGDVELMCESAAQDAMFSAFSKVLDALWSSESQDKQ